jgi:hypothetical protein
MGFMFWRCSGGFSPWFFLGSRAVLRPRRLPRCCSRLGLGLARAFGWSSPVPLLLVFARSICWLRPRFRPLRQVAWLARPSAPGSFVCGLGFWPAGRFGAALGRQGVAPRRDVSQCRPCAASGLLASRGRLVSAPVVMLCGSRVLPQGAGRRVGAVASALLSAGSVLAVGCAVGADAAVVSAVVSAGAASRLRLFAVGGRSGAGFAGRVSAPVGVRAALAAGAAVSWWAGGAASVPLRVRLVGRSLACVGAAAAGGHGSGLVAFVAQLPPRPFAPGAWPSCGSGSWASVGAAVLRGLPVVVVPVGSLVGVPVSSLPALPGWGSWAPVSAGALSGGFRWVPVV